MNEWMSERVKGLAGCPGSGGARRLMFTPSPVGEHSVHREYAVEVVNWHGHRGLASSHP